MHRTLACKKAHEMKAKMEDMMSKGKIPSEAEMAEYNNVYEFCKHMAGDAMWMGYNKELRGAIYPEELAHKCLTEDQAKEWVDSMYHKTMSGDMVKGEKWNIHTTTKVLEDAGFVFNENARPIEGYVLLNMMWHDHYKSAYKAGMENEPAFYVALAIDDLDDDDAEIPIKEKLYIKHYMMHHVG